MSAGPCLFFVDELIHITIPGSADDPRGGSSPPSGVVVHFAPTLRPEDVTVVDGVPVTIPARTLIDLAEACDGGELRVAFGRARELGFLDMAALRRARARVEWRPSLALFDEVLAEFDDADGS
jgi:hypothetical protein